MLIQPYPLKFGSKYVEKIWGGRRLATGLHKDLPPNRVIGESWEIYDLEGESSVIVNGLWQGQTLRQIMAQYGDLILGPLAESHSAFPLLIKFIDANDVLSVQVHPDDLHARRCGESNGKTESWIILGSASGEIVCGLIDGTDRPALIKAVKTGNVANLLHAYPVQMGDVFYIPAGTVHSIGAGVLLLEIQQNSNTTFRLYDWDRLGLNGQPRELHIPQALEVTDYRIKERDLRPETVKLHYGRLTYDRLIDSPYFVVERFYLTEWQEIPRQKNTFEILVAIDGRCRVISADKQFQPVVLKQGEVALLPAALGSYAIESENVRLIRSFVPS